MSCSLNCNNNSCSFSKYCLNHLYWDDLDKKCNIDNLSDNQQKIMSAITHYIHKKLINIYDCDDISTNIKNVKNLFKYVSHKPVLLLKYNNFRLSAVNKAKDILKTVLMMMMN